MPRRSEWVVRPEKLLAHEGELYHVAGRGPDVYEGERRVCRVDRTTERGGTDARAEVRAALIAAAPELLAAAKKAAKRIERLNVGTEELGDDPALVALLAAIAKAEGRTPVR